MILSHIKTKNETTESNCGTRATNVKTKRNMWIKKKQNKILFKIKTKTQKWSSFGLKAAYNLKVTYV